jgi:hypothetical protein
MQSGPGLGPGVGPFGCKPNINNRKIKTKMTTRERITRRIVSIVLLFKKFWKV